MNDLVKQISPSGILFTNPATTYLDYTRDNQFNLVDKYVFFGTSTSISKPTDRLNEYISYDINKLCSFLQLPDNWDSYGASRPSKIAVDNAIEFILRLAQKQQTPYFIAPSPNGDILIELKKDEVTLEFIFGEDGVNRITGLVNEDENFEKELNETTEYCSIKWLYCPNGNCFD